MIFRHLHLFKKGFDRDRNAKFDCAVSCLG
jgi:hypothetical protein